MARKIVSLEEHFLHPSLENEGHSILGAQKVHQLKDLGEERQAAIEAGKISVQVLSHVATPGDETPDKCRQVNDHTAEAIASSNGKYGAFAMLPMLYPKEAAVELERCVTELGFVGTMISNTSAGRFYDDEYFWPVFEKAQELDVPVYLHPSEPDERRAKEFYPGNYPDAVAYSLGTFAWGWHSDTGMHFVKLFAAGLFDKFPRLKFVLGHMGEMVPFMLQRLIRISSSPLFPKRERALRQVWDENVWITISGLFSLAPFACLVREVKIDRIMYSVDYPFGSNEHGLEFLHELENSDMVSSSDVDKIAGENAIKFLGLNL